ncbi:MAG: VOC family protein [Phycisphaeraceae bacterium]|nr:VOC family protein [Phycisphaeraceae bacterium]
MDEAGTGTGRSDGGPAGSAPGPALLGVHHVAIICSDYARSRDFYTRVLGLRVIAETERAERRSMKLDLELAGAGGGGVRLELFSFPDPPGRVTRPEACGLRHLAFAVMDIDETVRRLAALGVVCEGVKIDELTGKRYTFFNDPDGLPLEVYEVGG